MGENLQILFKDSTINKHTVRIARMLQMKFTDSTDFKSHYREVEDFLRIQFEDESKIEELLNFYKKFTEFKMSLDKPEHPLRQRNPETIDEAISLNNELQQYRRGLFGSEEADVLWGHEVKTSEYQLRKSKIMRANSYGEEKEKLIAALNEETWGDKAGEQGGETSFSQYENALTLYREDFSNMTDDESKEKRKELRHRFLTSDEAKRLDFFEKKFEADPEMKNFDPVAMEKEYALEMEHEKEN
ncbi:MAG: lipase chaperone [Desulfobacterales bacterium]|nr:lipase chaperone [Desulfobacterales bacterium]